MGYQWASAVVRADAQLATSPYRAFRPAMGVPVVTSIGLPKWRPESASWPRCWLLTPPRLAFHTDDPAEFAAGYLARLNQAGPQKIAPLQR